MYESPDSTPVFRVPLVLWGPPSQLWQFSSTLLDPLNDQGLLKGPFSNLDFCSHLDQQFAKLNAKQNHQRSLGLVFLCLTYFFCNAKAPQSLRPANPNYRTLIRVLTVFRSFQTFLLLPMNRILAQITLSTFNSTEIFFVQGMSLADVSSLGPCTYIRQQLTLPIIVAPREPMPLASMDTRTHVHTPTHRYTYTQFKNNKNKMSNLCLHVNSWKEPRVQKEWKLN